MSQQQRYPLSWPTNWKRTPWSQRKAAMFSKRTPARTNIPGYNWTQKTRLDVGDGLSRLTGELKRLGARDVIISSNLRTRQDGLPYSNQAKQLDDPGVAVYFTLNKAPRVLACDRWNSAADNMAAIAGHIEAIRAVDRYGVGTIEQAFAGYAALPPAAIDWWIILNVSQSASIDEVEDAYRTLARGAHPDAGGNNDQMVRLNAARDAARKALLVNA